MSIWILNNNTGSGGGGSANWSDFVRNEIPTGTVNGINVSYTAANTYIQDSLVVYIDGVQIGANFMTASSGTPVFVLSSAPASGEVLWISYIKTS